MLAATFPTVGMVASGEKLLSKTFLLLPDMFAGIIQISTVHNCVSDSRESEEFFWNLGFEIQWNCPLSTHPAAHYIFGIRIIFSGIYTNYLGWK
jgi:hypothetical protein